MVINKNAYMVGGIMKIKLAILEKDASYLNRFIAVFSTKYADKMEIYSFTDKEVAIPALESNRINVFIASDVYEIDVNELPKRCSFAYLVDSPDVEMVNEQRAICKFQKLDLIYKQILSVYSENAGNISDLKIGDETTKVIAFASPSGGVGCSSVAAACALYFAAQGKKTLYLNLERFGSADRFFAAEGQFDMSDVIFAVKSKKANLPLKLESCVKQDPRGVYFYSETQNAMDMLELKNDECVYLISELKISGTYEYIILDLDFMMGKDMLSLYHQTHAMVWVGDGSDISNGKIKRAYEALSMVEANSDMPLTSRMCLLYNRFSSKTSSVLEGVEIKNIGGIKKFEHATTQQVITQQSNMDVFEKIV